MSRHDPTTRAALAMAVLGIAATSNAQWTVFNLHPAGASASHARGVDGGHQVGDATFGSITRASLWFGTAGSWVDLSASGASSSWLSGVAGGHQVGTATVSGVSRASLWSGSAASWVDLSVGPLGARESLALGASSGQQVGWVIHTGAVTHASLWSGTAGSWVDLHPPAASYSQALATHGGQQVGWAGVGGHSHASLWTGTAASWIDLHPPGAGLQSEAYGAFAGQQVGSAIVGGVERASLWSGTAGSWVDLHPPGAARSLAFSIGETGQVGMADLCGWHASLWSGSAASWVHLHAFLPRDFTSSRALGIWTDGALTYVVGSGFNSTTGRDEALMWVQPAGPTGACCQGTACSVVLPGACVLGQFRGTGSACGTPTNPTTCCPANYNGVGGVTVADIFAFLTAWFAGDARADFNGQDCVSVQDIFAFLSAWFAGCT